jgi:hypothetical protein
MANDPNEVIAMEARWFFDGQAPVEVQGWFNGLPGDLAKTESRPDHYLVIPGRDDLGLKIREGGLELKWRARSDPFAHGETSGTREVWNKERWDFKMGGNEDLIEASSSESLTDASRTVSKQRSQRKYHPDEGNELEPVNMDKRLDEACIVELTAIEIDGNHGWTIAIEAIGSPTRVEAIFALCIEELLIDYQGPTLSTLRSFGYPQRLLLN